VVKQSLPCLVNQNGAQPTWSNQVQVMIAKQLITVLCLLRPNGMESRQRTWLPEMTLSRPKRTGNRLRRAAYMYHIHGRETEFHNDRLRRQRMSEEVSFRVRLDSIVG
jgi:hypothetical protein